jgi:hypothetical protein
METDVTEDTPSPSDLIRRYGALYEAVAPLATLARVSPGMLEDVIALAMAMGIYAGERKAEENRKIKLVEGLMERKLNVAQW